MIIYFFHPNNCILFRSAFLFANSSTNHDSLSICMFSYSWIVFQHFLLLLIVCYLKNCHFTIQGERDAISAKIEDSQAHLEMLEHTDILNDVFYISHYGIFGTINSLRLGHTHVVGIPIAKCKDKTLIHYILFEAHF